MQGVLSLRTLGFVVMLLEAGGRFVVSMYGVGLWYRFFGCARWWLEARIY